MWSRTMQILQHKAPYLNVPFFFLRTAIYFAIWTVSRVPDLEAVAGAGAAASAGRRSGCSG